MRIRIFRFDADPTVDSPICLKSKSYAADLIARGRAVYLDKKSIQLAAPPHIASDRELKSGSMADWITRQVSFLPQGQTLRVTTRQLNA